MTLTEVDESNPPSLPARPRDGHKGTFGTAVIVGGCAAAHVRMIGAPALSALGALRAGAGLCRILAPAPIIGEMLTICPSATGVALPVNGEGSIIVHAAAELLDDALKSASVLAIGPGLGRSDVAESLVLRALAQETTPVIVDADGLHALAALCAQESPIRAPTVLTPHPGEFRALAEAVRLNADPVAQEARPAAAQALANRLGCVVILKGAGTVVSDGSRAWVCPRGTPALGTAGTGDVLTGVTAGVIAQHVPPPRPEISALPESVRAKLPTDPHRPLDLYDAARVAVLAHASAGELWAERAGATGGLLAPELADLIPGTLVRRAAAES